MWSYYDKEVEVSELNAKVIKSINGLEQYSERVEIEAECGQKYVFLHQQNCCEDVRLEDFTTDDIVGATVISSTEETNSEDSTGVEYPDSFTWTFYKIQTTKGELWMRWLGVSNGYYSEDVDLIWLNKPKLDI